jgi:sulfur-oxidizing protein SoxA
MRCALAALALGLLASGAPLAEPARSGFDLMSPRLQAMQRDDSLNPGMLWVQDGRARWSQADGAARKSCAGCHGPTPGAQLRAAATRHPAWDEAEARSVNLAQRVNLCRQRHQQAAPLAEDSEPVLALTAALAHAARGLPVAPPEDPRLGPARDEGRRLWSQRMGQLDLSCADCHDRLAGRRLGGSAVPPGNAAGYPTYRLEWQTLGPLTRRIRNCLNGVRAETWPIGSPAMRAMEVWLAQRDRGLPLEAPAIRP